MPLHSDPAAVSATSSCFQHAQDQNSMCQLLFILGVSFPVIIWPLLPSTFEVVSYRILTFSSLAQFISTLLWLWNACALTTDVDDTLRLLSQRILGVFINPLLCCYFTVGIIGHGAEKSGKRLGRRSFDVPAYITIGILPTVTPVLGEYLFNTSTNYFTIAGLMLMGILLRPGTELAMTAYYHFVTRRISLLYWLPQNGSGTHFNPWWSHSLRIIWVGYTLLLVYVSMATICFARDCQRQLGQEAPLEATLASVTSLFKLAASHLRIFD